MLVRAVVMPPAAHEVRDSLRKSEQRSARAPPADLAAAS